MCFTYDCEECDAELRGGFGEDVHCEKCDICYETDFDLSYSDHDYSYSAWIVKRKECDGNCSL